MGVPRRVSAREVQLALVGRIPVFDREAVEEVDARLSALVEIAYVVQNGNVGDGPVLVAEAAASIVALKVTVKHGVVTHGRRGDGSFRRGKRRGDRVGNSLYDAASAHDLQAWSGADYRHPGVYCAGAEGPAVLDGTAGLGVKAELQPMSSQCAASTIERCMREPLHVMTMVALIIT